MAVPVTRLAAIIYKKNGMEAEKKRVGKKISKVYVVLGKETEKRLKGSLMYVDGVLLGVASFFSFLFLYMECEQCRFRSAGN
jgi:hypothetical protein